MAIIAVAFGVRRDARATAEMHTARKVDRSNIVKVAGRTSGPAPSAFEDADFAAFEAELLRRM